MNGIDTAIASLLSGRIDGLTGSSGAAAGQAGASSLNLDLPALTPALPPGPPVAPPSAQTVLSAVALTLDAISRFGGEATPVLMGDAPIMAAPPAIRAAIADLLLALDLPDAAPNATSVATSPGAAGGPQSTLSPPSAQAAQTTQAAQAAQTVQGAPMTPVEALAAALEQTVSQSGLFYESHLVQWLAGQLPLAALAAEPQARLAADVAQLPFDWEAGMPLPGEEDASLSALLGESPGAPGAGTPSQQQMAGTAPGAGMPFAGMARGGGPASSTMYTAPSANGQGFAQTSTSGGNPATLLAAQVMRTNSALPDAPASIAASIHPATIPLVRQQLDLLATEQFRWSGEVWPGAKLNWTIEPDDAGHRQDQSDADVDRAWRTRVTLSLPTLGTIDAELTLTGTRLIARMQASPDGAVRLASRSAALRQRLADGGIELDGLLIRETGGAAPFDAQASVSAYARSAAQASAAQTVAAVAGPAPRPAPSTPLDRLFGGANGDLGL